MRLEQVTQAPLSLTAARSSSQPSVAVLLPCHNEELTIGQVVRDFRTQLPEATIYVFDNNSSDRTTEEARRAGAIVVGESRQGKGYVVQAMFQRLDADIYIMADGDGTYPPSAVHALMAPVVKGEADMVVGSRLHPDSQSRFRWLNRWGNRAYLFVLNGLFHVKLTDILSGYRAFSHKFVKDMPVFASGFEIEAELTIKALHRGHRIVEVPVDLRSRPEGSYSKIRLVRDGLLILNTILALFRDYRPLTFFGLAGLGFLVAGLVPGVLVITEFLRTGVVLRLPSALLAVGLVLSGILLIMAGLIVHTVLRRFQELDYKLQTLSDSFLRSHGARNKQPPHG